MMTTALAIALVVSLWFCAWVAADIGAAEVKAGNRPLGTEFFILAIALQAAAVLAAHFAGI